MQLKERKSVIKIYNEIISENSYFSDEIIQLDEELNKKLRILFPSGKKETHIFF